MGEDLRNLELDRPGTETLEALTEIWQRVLQRSNIGPRDTFHDLGGNDGLADRVFAEIARVFDRELPSATISHAPTIAALAAVLEQPTLPRFSPLVKLKAGTGKAPVVIAPGLDGRARFSKLAKQIHTEHAIYGLQARGVDGMEEPQERIEDMAKVYLEALGELQPAGPYLLIGYSFGGLVALEMAQRLVESGRPVALLVLVDTYPHPRYLSPGQRLRLTVRRMWRHVSEMRQRPARGAISYFMRGLARRLHIADMRQREALPPETSRLSFAYTTVQVHKTAYMAYRRYHPRFYRGSVKFVKAGVNSYFPDDPAAVWGKLTDKFEMQSIPGGHLDIVNAEFENLAAVLTDYLRGAPCQE